MRAFTVICLAAAIILAVSSCAEVMRWAEPAPERPPAAEATVFTIGEGAAWSRPETDAAQFQVDADACLGYAQAQIAHDVQVERDIGAAREPSQPGLGLKSLKGRMSAFERQQRERELFRDCMTSQGYASQ
jgi:hypothetical protein